MYYNKVEICGVNTSELKVLTDAEKRELLIKTKAGDTAARQELINGNLRLVLSVVQRFTGRRENLDDLFQVGCIGLVKAVDNFNIELDVKFSTYAVPIIIECRNQKRSFDMTRKQAIYLAIQALSDLKGQEEAISLLQDIYDEMPLIHWSDKSIRDTVEQFIIDNGRSPTASDFRKKAMPPHPVFKQKYKITLGEWLQENYPTPKPDKTELKKKYTQDFIDEYIRLKPTSSDDFNNRRNSKIKTWISIANYNGVKTWCELLDKLSLPSYSRITHTKHRKTFDISITTDCDFFNDYIKKYS